jgi:hypothetical protein
MPPVIIGAGAAAFIGAALWGGGLYGASKAIGGLAPEPPAMPPSVAPPAPVDAGAEGIRTGAEDRLRKRRALGQSILTKGQKRGAATTLGGAEQTLG